MHLRTPSWAEAVLRTSAVSSAAPSPGVQSPVVDLVITLTNRRLYREVMLALRTGLRDAKAEFTFMRVKGLRSLTKFLDQAAKAEKVIEHFLESQNYSELQVVPVIFDHTLAPPKREANEPTVGSAPSKAEIGLGLRILEGCCLLDSSSRLLASRHAAAKVIITLLVQSERHEQVACLDALLAVLLDSASNQKEFDRAHGVRKIAELVKSTSVDESVRLKGAEFLLVLIGLILPVNARPANGFLHADGRKGVVTIEGAQQDVVDVLGRRCGVILDAITSSQPPMSDFDTQQTSLRTLARSLLNACVCFSRL